MAKNGNPTPEERAEMAVRRLERFIREGGSKVSDTGRSGMSFKKWQDMAKVEIAAAVREAEIAEAAESKVFNLFLVVSGSCLVSLGFLGAVVAFGQMDKTFAAYTAGALGGVFLATSIVLMIRGYFKRVGAMIRASRISRIEQLDLQIKKMERMLEEKKGILRREIEFS